MSLNFQLEQRERYALVRLDGEPTLGQFLSFIQLMGVESASWPVRRVLFDLREVRTLTTFLDHYAIGQEAARHLQHLARIASLVPPERITRTSEKTARQSGINLKVFTEEAEAIAWLTA
jgi:hypothetical protein